MNLTNIFRKKEVIHPDVKGLVIYRRKVCLNGKIRNHWEGEFRLNGDQHQVYSLNGCPRVIDNYFLVFNQKHLKTLNGSPKNVNNVSVWNCSKIQDLTGITPDCGSYWIGGNDSLLSLNGISTTNETCIYTNNNQELSFTACQFPSIKTLDWRNNKDVSLHDFHKHFPKISNRLTISNKIQSRVLSVLLIEGLQKIYSDDNLEPLVAIINKHLPNTTGKKGMLRCQAALIDAGYAAYAQL